MARHIITTDQHAGVSGRLQDIIWGLRVVREYACRHNISTILSLGDLFHNRASLEIDALCAIYDFLLAARQQYDQRWIIIPGNHDMFLKHSWEVNSLKPISQVVTLIDTVKILKIDGHRFWVLPFVYMEAAYMRILKQIEERHEEGDVLLTHTGVLGAIKNTCFLLKDWGLVHFGDSKFDRVYTGHFHSTQQVGHNVWYPGSPIPFKADEGDCQHGFFVYDSDIREHMFIDIWEQGKLFFPDEVPPPNYLTVTEEALNDLAPDVVRNNIVRIAVTDERTPHECSKMQEILRAAGARDVRLMWLQTEDDAPVALVSAGDCSQLFDDWLEADETGRKGLSLPILKKLNEEIVREGDEAYQFVDD